LPLFDNFGPFRGSFLPLFDTNLSANLPFAPDPAKVSNKISAVYPHDEPRKNNRNAPSPHNIVRSGKKEDQDGELKNQPIILSPKECDGENQAFFF
jgi:hypothetical protein